MFPEFTATTRCRQATPSQVEAATSPRTPTNQPRKPIQHDIYKKASPWHPINSVNCCPPKRQEHTTAVSPQCKKPQAHAHHSPSGQVADEVSPPKHEHPATSIPFHLLPPPQIPEIASFFSRRLTTCGVRNPALCPGQPSMREGSSYQAVPIGTLSVHLFFVPVAGPSIIPCVLFVSGLTTRLPKWYTTPVSPRCSPPTPSRRLVI